MMPEAPRGTVMPVMNFDWPASPSSSFNLDNDENRQNLVKSV
jgi:hypothetical protein